MKKVSCSLSISMNCECPNCGAYIDLLDPDDTNGDDLNEDGFLLEQACPQNGYWSDIHEKFESGEITCTQCKSVFESNRIHW